jgi:uncharacterized protein (TIGR02246 family)
MSTQLEARLGFLEERVRRLEDERQVAQVVAAYGPLVDGGDAERVAALWEQDGVYDVDELLMSGRAQIEAMVRSPAHQRWIEGGCAHLVGPPHVAVTDDEAVAVCHSLMVVHEQGTFVLRRATANRWRLRRSADGWQVTERTNRVLDGRPEAPELLRDVVT